MKNIKCTLFTIIIIILFSFNICIPGNAQNEKRKVKGNYIYHEKYSGSTYTLRNRKFKSIDWTDRGKGKSNGSYIINWQDSTITFNYKKSKRKIYGHKYIKSNSNSIITIKIKNTNPFSFGRYEKNEDTFFERFMLNVGPF